MSHYGAVYELLDPAEGDSIIVLGGLSLPLAMYLAGRSSERNVMVAAKAIVHPNDRVQTVSGALLHAEESMPYLYNTLRGGIPYTFMSQNIGEEDVQAKYPKAAIVQEDAESWRKNLHSLSSLHFLKTVVLSLPLDFTLPFTRGGSASEMLGFRRVIESMGFKVEYYDTISNRLYAVLAPRKIRDAGDFRMMTVEEASSQIHAGFTQKMLGLAEGSRLAVRSANNDYIYIVAVSEGTGSIDYHFPFAVNSTQEDVKKDISVSVLPNTASLSERLEGNGIPVIGYRKAVNGKH